MAEQVPQRPNDIIGMPAVLDYLLDAKPVPDEPIVQGRLKLSAIFPPDQWWRVYLDRQHHADAVQRDPKDPGYLYDTQQSKGFQQSMVQAYELVLQGDEFADKFANATLLYEDYKQFYDLVTAKVKIIPRKKTNFVTFDVEPGRPASDAAADILCGRSLMDVAKPSDPDQVGRVIALVMELEPNAASRGGVCVEMSKCPSFIDAAFERFRGEIGEARTQKAQLHAIAKLIRFLHVLHTFSDGNGRLNIHFMLPRLLLQYGFGLPLRLGPCCAPGTLFGLFNGCFTLDQIVVFLWHAQQRPGEPPESLDLSTVTHW